MKLKSPDETKMPFNCLKVVKFVKKPNKSNTFLGEWRQLFLDPSLEISLPWSGGP